METSQQVSKISDKLRRDNFFRGKFRRTLSNRQIPTSILLAYPVSLNGCAELLVLRYAARSVQWLTWKLFGLELQLKVKLPSRFLLDTCVLQSILASQIRTADFCLLRFFSSFRLVVKTLTDFTRVKF